MFNVKKIVVNIEGKTRECYAVTGDGGFCCELGEDEQAARKFAELLNFNEVSECHAADVIEDYFYS